MSIAFESTDELEQLRSRLRKMSDDELMRFGEAARSLCRDPRCPDTFKRQLAERVRSRDGGIRKRIDNCSDARQTSRAEPLEPVHVRVKDENIFMH